MNRKVFLALASAATYVAVPSAAHAQTGYSCPTLIAEVEARRQIPRGLLMAIAVTESGLNGVPNPFAMNINGRAYHARDTNEMAQIISAKFSRGVRSIDVGCMQINLLHHGDKFQSPTELLHAPTNVEYGATFLIQLAVARGSWREGVMDYHNKASDARRRWYGCRVWNNYLRINSATTGYLNCGKTPQGSSVASASAAPQRPLTIPGYNVPAAAQAAAVPASARPMIGGQPLVTSSVSTNHAPPTFGSVPLGSPLDSAPGAGVSAPTMTAAAVPYDVPQPKQRVTGTIELASAAAEIGDVSTSADPRASAFRAVRPQDWSGRIQAEASAQEQPTTSRTASGFYRTGPGGQ